MFYAPILLTVGSNILYHIFQKVIPANVNPVVSLTITYLAAALATVLLFPLFPLNEGWSSALRRVNWASLALGVSIVGLELGFLLAYRAGWKVSLAGLLSNVAVGLVLLPIGLLFFRERLTGLNLLGVAFSLVGLGLMGLR